MTVLVESLNRGEGVDHIGTVLVDQAAGAAGIGVGDAERAVEGVGDDTCAEGPGPVEGFHDDHFVGEDREEHVGSQRTAQLGGQPHRVLTDHDTALGPGPVGGVRLVRDSDGAPIHPTRSKQRELVHARSVDRGDTPASIGNLRRQLDRVVLRLRGVKRPRFDAASF
jgi:hypothetical protein